MNEIAFNRFIAPDFKGGEGQEINVNDAVYYGDYTHFVLKGGRGSCKSSFVSLQIIAGMQDPANKNTHAVILRKVAENLYDSVYQQLLWAIDVLGQQSEWKASKSPMMLTYLRTGQKILFRGADEPEKIKSIKARNGYFRWIWFEELDQFSGEEEVRKILQSLMRGGERFTVFYSYNPPRSANNWVNAWTLGNEPGRLVHHSSYLTVPPEWLGEQFFIEANNLEARNETAYDHEYLGKVTGTGGQVFDNVVLRAITDEEIRGFEYVYPGLDLGFTVNPSAYVECAYSSGLKRLFIFHELYKVGLSNEALAHGIKIRPHKRTTIADSEDPRTINELRILGVNIEGAKKGPDSVDHGMKWLQKRYEIIIDPVRCPNVTREFLGYEYEQDRQGNFKAQYPDKNNHAISATRYAMEKTMLMSDQPARFIASGNYTQTIDFRRR